MVTSCLIIVAMLKKSDIIEESKNRKDGTFPAKCCAEYKVEDLLIERSHPERFPSQIKTLSTDKRRYHRGLEEL